MNRINLYVGIVAVVLFAGHLVNYSPEKPEITLSTYPAAISAPRTILLVEDEPFKVYDKDKRLSAKEIKDILYSVGFRGENLKQAWAVVMKESTGRPMAHNQNSKTGDNSYGLFQINMIGKMGPDRLKEFGLESNEDLFDPVRNAEIAFELSKGGKNWSPWNGITKKTIEWMSKFPG
jgi:hypothetical protein